MFKKLQKHIYVCLMMISFVMVGITVITSTYLTAQSLNNSYVNIAADRLKRDIDSCSMYIYSVQISAADIAGNDTVVNVITGGGSSSLTQILDDACNFAMEITAITLYSADGRTYTSSGINDIPSYTELENVDGFRDFLSGEDSSFVSVRTDTIARIYNGNSYNGNMGIITCFEKIFDDGGNYSGVVAADILPQALYDIITASDSGSQTNSTPLITVGDTYLISTDNSLYAAEMAEVKSSKTKSSDGKYVFITSDETLYGCRVINAVILSPLHKDIIIESAIIIAAGIIVEICVHFVSLVIARQITKRLDRLYYKMEKDETGFA